MKNLYLKMVLISQMKRCLGAWLEIYLTHTRPDLTYVVSFVFHYMHLPSKIHLDAVRRILSFPVSWKTDMGLVKVAFCDGVLTFLWVFCVSCLGAATSAIAKATGIHGVASLFISLSLIFVLLCIFGVIAAVLGGASFSPTGTAAFYAVGIGRDSLISTAVRFPAQAVGAVGGAMAVLEFMPSEYKHMLGGPSLKVDMHTGAIAESILTFTSTMLVLFIILRGPKSAIMKNWLLSMSMMTLVVFGRGYTGPSMNPANAFGWAYINNRHNTWEQFYVYWISPFVGAISAAWIFRILFPPPSKVKSA